MSRDLEKKRAYQREYNRTHRKEKRQWEHENRDKVNAQRKRWHANSSDWHYKDTARKILYTELRAGRIVRPANCERCGCECKPEAHHPDYTEPLNVIWLCQKCHLEVSHVQD